MVFTAPWFTQTVPASSASLTSVSCRVVAGEQVGDQSVVGIVGEGDGFVERVECSRPGSTRPNVSSRITRIVWVQPVRSVGR